MVKGGVAQQMVRPDVFQALSAVGGLKKGRTTARESKPVGPVDPATLRHKVIDLLGPFYTPEEKR